MLVEDDCPRHPEINLDSFRRYFLKKLNELECNPAKLDEESLSRAKRRARSALAQIAALETSQIRDRIARPEPDAPGREPEGPRTPAVQDQPKTGPKSA